MDCFPKKLRYLREKNGFTLEMLAGELGISKSLLWDLERGRRRVHGDLLRKIAVFFSVSADYLLGLVSSEDPDGAGMPKYQMEPETVRVIRRMDALSPMGKEQLLRLAEWVFEVEERGKKKDPGDY